MLRKIYGDNVRNIILLLSIFPLFVYGYNYSIKVNIVFIIYFILLFIWKINNKKFKNKIHLIINIGIIFSFLPGFLSFSIFRFFLLFELVSKIKGMQLVTKFLKENKDIFRVVLAILLGYILVMSLLMYNIEPKMFNYKYFNALYWSGITLTTVGYGDLVPITNIGKFFTVFSSVFGLIVVALLTGMISAKFIEYLRNILDKN